MSKDLLQEIEKLSLEDALQLDIALKSVIEKRRSQTRRQAVSQINELMNNIGLSREELLKMLDGGQNRPVSSRATVRPKYADPNDPNKTWTGRGRAPLWVVEYENQGGKRDDLLIPNAEQF